MRQKETGIREVAGREFLADLPSVYKNFLDGNSFVLAIFGRPGTGKRYHLRQFLEREKKSCVVEPGFVGDSAADSLFQSLVSTNGKVVVFYNCNALLESKQCRDILFQAVDGRVSNPTKNNDGPSRIDIHGKILLLDDPYSKSVKLWNSRIPGYRYSWTIVDLIEYCRIAAASLCNEARCDESALARVLNVYETALEKGFVDEDYAGEECGISFSVKGVIQSSIQCAELGRIEPLSFGQHFSPVAKYCQ